MCLELVWHTLRGIISVVGNWPKRISTIGVEGKIGESGISTEILDSGRWQIMWWTSRPCEHWKKTNITPMCTPTVLPPYIESYGSSFIISYVILWTSIQALYWNVMILTLYLELNWTESCLMQVYHLKSSCQAKTSNAWATHRTHPTKDRPNPTSQRQPPSHWNLPNLLGEVTSP